MPIRVTRSVIPSMFTAMNLFCGFLAMIKARDGLFSEAVMFIVLGGVFDALDGMMARLTNSSSEFGVELDSLADVISFSLAPSFILYTAFFSQWKTFGVIVSAMPAICGAVRLARFNVQLVGYSKEYFRGLPTPAAACALMSYLVFEHLPHNTVVPDEAKPVVLGLMTAGISLLMVSTIRYESMPSFTPGALRKSPVKSILVVLALAVSVATSGRALFPVIALYIVGGLVRHIIHLFRSRSQQDEEDDTIEEADPSPFDI